jgi:hypothetical protein
MKIQRIETFSNVFVCLVRVTTDTGARGWGQVASYQERVRRDITPQDQDGESKCARAGWTQPSTR